MMRPPPALRMCGTQARQHSATPRMLTSITLRHSATSICSKGFNLIELKIAALLTRMSMRPKALTVSAASRATSASEETSICKPSVRAPVALAISAAARSNFATSATTTEAPSAREPGGKRLADAAARAGDDGDFAAQPQVHTTWR